MFKAIKAIKLTVAWSLNCLHVIVCVAVRCPGELTKDLTLKANAKAKDLTFKAKDWIVQCFTSHPTQYRLYGRRFLQVKRPNQQYQSTEGHATKYKSNNGNNIKQTCIDNNRHE